LRHPGEAGVKTSVLSFSRTSGFRRNDRIILQPILAKRSVVYVFFVVTLINL